MKLKKILAVTTLACLTAASSSNITLAADVATYNSNGQIEFVPNDDITPPVDPENPDPENPVNPVDPTDPEGPDPGTPGPLSIDYASSLDFGINKISSVNETYYARAQTFNESIGSRPNYVQVTDSRGTNAGWTLSVKQNGQLTATTATTNDVLTGAEIVLKNPAVKSNGTAGAPGTNPEIRLDPNGASANVMFASDGAGGGTWINLWGSVEQVQETDAQGNTVTVDVNKDIYLTVPGATPKDAVKYATTLTWTLSDVPSNGSEIDPENPPVNP